MSKCSSDAPHLAHTFGGRPMQYCPGVDTPKPQPKINSGSQTSYGFIAGGGKV